MKNIITIIVVVSSLIFAQKKDTLMQYNLGEIEVTARKENQLNSVEISQKEFQMQNSFSAFDALQFSPGVYASVSGKNEAQLSIRGFDQRQISVMIDGAPVYIPYDGSFDLNAIQLAGFNKISISKNVSSILYGPNSMGGSINLISEYPVKNFSAKVNYQKGNSQNLNIGFNGILSAFYFNAAFGYHKSNGFALPSSFSAAANEDGERRENSGYDSKASMLKLGTKIFDFLDVAFAYNHIDNERDVPVNIYTTNPRYWRYSDWNKSLANLMFNSVISSNFTIRGNIFYDKYTNVLDSYDDATLTTQTKKYAFHSTYDDYSYGLNLSSYISSEILPLTKIIFLYKRDSHKEQSNYGQPYKKFEAEIFTIGVEEEFSIVDNFKIVAGISYDKMNPLFAENSLLRPASSSLHGNLGLNFNLNENFLVYMIASKKSRFPTLKEFYSELLGSYKPNYDLAPEQSYNFEVGASTMFSDLYGGVSLFFSDVRDLIQIVLLGNNIRQYQNINKAALKGTEVELKYKFSVFNVALNYTYLSAKNITEDAELPNRPEHVLNLLLNKNYDFGFEWNTEASFISNQYSFDSDSRELKRLPDYLIIGLRIAQKIFSDYKFYFRINNITDKYYETEYGFPQPGRAYFVGILAEW